jgi:eukaryotic-like serine/threonine-protein kinase
MSPRTSSQPVESINGADDSSLRWARDIASTVKNRWHNGAVPNLAGVLESQPALKNHRTVVLELAYEEYQLRLKAGETLDADAFAQRFHSLERSLYFYIVAQSALGNDPHLFALHEAAPWPEIGSEFLGFDLIAELGRGAIGRVYLASELALGERRVVLKVALQGSHEAEILGRLRHPNIVPIYSIQEDNASGLTAFCMPYLGRATLAAVLDAVYAGHRPPLQAKAILDGIQTANAGADLPESPLPDRILRHGTYMEGVIHLAMQLAGALAHAHARGIFHRDLKPSNILMSPDGRPLLLDFNLSVDDRQPAGRVGGTVPYMAPEELSSLCGEPGGGRPFCYDPRSDLFSLGVIIYEILTGALPFGTIPCGRPVDEIADQLRRRQAKGPRPIREQNRHVDKRLARLIESCLAFDPDLRPKDADAVVAALGKELTRSRRMGRWLAGHRRLVLIAAAAAMSLLLGLAAFFMLRPAYAVRQFQQGLAYYRAGQDDQALDCLNDSLRADPRQSEALIARARVHQHRGGYELALADYSAAARLAPSPILDASLGYCSNRLAHDRVAARFYSQALEAGYASPVVLNNLGYCWLKFGQLEDAEACLRRAILADGNLQAAHHNLVLVFLQQVYTGKTIPPEAFEHARRAEETGPASAELCRDLAFLYALASQRNAALAKPAAGLVAKAVALGIDAETFKTDPAFSGLQQDPGFQKALLSPQFSPKPPPPEYVIDPSGELYPRLR